MNNNLYCVNSFWIRLTKFRNMMDTTFRTCLKKWVTLFELDELKGKQMTYYDTKKYELYLKYIN